MAKILHEKVKALKLRSTPIALSGAYVDENGDLQNLDLRIETSEADRTVQGYLAVWGVKDSMGTIAVRNCFAKSIKERGPGSAAKAKIAFLWFHEQDQPIGQFTELKEDDYGLYFKAVLDDVPKAERALKQIRSGTLNQFSVGFRYLWDKMEYDETNDAVLMYECELWEGSVCLFGSNQETYALRSADQLVNDRLVLIDETEEFIKTLPRTQQLELRQLITRNIALAKVNQPDEPLKDKVEPKDTGLLIGGYNFKI